jgi:hypothetical protein
MGHSHSIKEYPGQIAGIAAIAAAVGAAGGLLMDLNEEQKLVIRSVPRPQLCAAK